jgi:hypothetical protein
MEWDFLLFVAVAMAAVIPAMAQTRSAAGPAGSEAHHATPVPELSRVWNHPAFPWFEPPASGPWPITNLSRWPEQRPQGEDGSAALPGGKVGISNHHQLVGDYKTPILQPRAAAVVKKFNEISLAGIPLVSPVLLIT